MSDTWDHEADAYDDAEMRSDEDTSSEYRKAVHNRPLAVPTIWVEYTKLVTQTSRAFKLTIEVHGYPEDVWLPKALCWDMSKDRVLLPEAFWLNKLEEI